MNLAFSLLAGAVVALGIAAWLYWGGRHLEPSERWLRSVVVFCGYAALLCVASGVYEAPVVSWNAARIAPLLGWMQGFPIYSTATEGAIQSTMYPPFSALAYIPASAAYTPVLAILMAAIIAQAYYVIPLGVACYRTSVRNGSLALVVLSFLVFWSQQSAGLWQSQSWVHADAPALGLTLLACVATFRYTESESNRALCLAIAGAWLAIWTKQVAIGVLPALALWILYVRGPRKCAAFVGWSAAAGGVLAVCMGLAFSLEGMWFNLFVIPTQVGWVGRTPFNLIRALTELLREGMIPLAVLIGGVFYSRWYTEGHEPWRDWTRRQPWLLPALVGVVNVPISVLGRVKEGGLENNLSFSLYFWMAAAGMFVLSHHQVLDREGQGLTASRYKIVVGTLAVWMALLSLPQSLRVFLTLLPPGNYSAQVTYDTIRRNPGRYYFPDYPLSHLLAENQLFHFSAAVRDREEWAGISVSPQQMRAHIPPQFDVLCLDVANGKPQSKIRERHIAGYSQQVDTLSEAGLRCYTRENY